MELVELAAAVGAALLARQMKLTTAESCTGGWTAQEITAIPGSSAWFDRGFITYSNDAKEDMLGLPNRTLKEFGAVSEETAAEMAAGALIHSQADVALAITGIAGPAGGSPDKPVGTVCFSWCRYGFPPITRRKLFSGDRESVRRQAVAHSLEGLLHLLDSEDGEAIPAKSVP